MTAFARPARKLGLLIVGTAIASTTLVAASSTSSQDECGRPPLVTSDQQAAGFGDTMNLNDDPPHRAYFQLFDGQDGPPPEVGHWRSYLPHNREVPSDPDHILVADSFPETEGTFAHPTFAGQFVGTLETLAVKIARGTPLNLPPPQAFLHFEIVIDGVQLVHSEFPVDSEDGALDLCHLAYYGLYHVILTDVDLAMEAAGIPNGPDVTHTMEFSFAPSGLGGAAPVETFAIDSTVAASGLTFNGPKFRVTQVSLAP